MVGENLNMINQWGNHKKGDQIFKFQWEKAKGGITIFDINLVKEKTLEETMVFSSDMEGSAARLRFFTPLGNACFQRHNGTFLG